MNPHDIRISAEDTIALLEETLEATHDGLLVLDLDRRIVRYNRPFTRMYGLTAADIDRRGMDAVAAALSSQVEDAGHLFVNLAESWDNTSAEVLDTLRFNDGRVFERFIAPHRIGGRIVGRVISYRDITQTVRAERAIEEHRASLEKAQEVAHIGSWVAELDGSDRLEWSNETYRIFGIDRGTFAATAAAFFAFVHPDDVDAVRRARNAARVGECPYDMEHRIVRADGSVRWVHDKADLARDAAGRPHRMVGIVQDITEKRQLEEAVRQSQKLDAIGRLAGGIAHDLNNSLTAIIGYTELALGALAGSHPAHADVNEIRRAASRAESVTRQLLAFSRKQMLEPRVFSLSDSVSKLERMFEYALGSGISRTINLAPDAPCVYGDPGQIEQAILNIVLNARDAMPDGGALTLSVSHTVVGDGFAGSHEPMPPGPYVELRITDTGHGMDAATRARVFEPFFTTKDIGKGTGLGLSMAYGTVLQSGGHIFVESEVGKGTTFAMYFPPSQGEHRPPPQPAARAGKQATILVVEDEAAVRTIVVTSLRRQGHRVLHAASAAEAIAISAEERAPIDLLLTDASMPGMTGIDLAKTLTASRPEMLIVVMSGFSEQTLELGQAGLAAVLLPKPFAPAELQRSIAEILAGRPPSRS